ncbi:MAG TPA: GGDEF domain-containing protein [Coriobacteriia bacterium]|jgi:diguanylate cyclase (GGDEF)-like protein
MRRLRVTSREQPTQYDIEALEENVRRVALVIRFRWMLVGALAVFSLAAAAIFGLDPSTPRSELLANMWIPAAALVFVLAYNTYYQLTVRYLGNIAVLNHAQLLFDTLVITVLVHYSGGVYSWFHTIYALIVLEAAFIFRRSRDTWLVAGAAAIAYGATVLSEYTGLIGHVAMPFVGRGLEHAAPYAAVRFLWMVAVLGGTALISLQMMSRVHQREQQLTASSMTDEATGLYNRSYFQHKLGVEVQRARCYGMGLGVLLLDVDDFGGFNRRFGIDAGNRLIRRLAELLKAETCACPDCAAAELNTIGRFGGEEFAIIMPQPPGMTIDAVAADAHALAERLRTKIGALRVDDMGVTVSIGVAHFPSDGRTAADLMASADQAVFRANSEGGNRVATSDEPDLGAAL